MKNWHETPCVCKSLTFSEVIEQELKHNQDNRRRCYPPCTVLHTGQAYKHAKKTVKGYGAPWGVETVPALLHMAARSKWHFLGSTFTQLDHHEQYLIQSPYQNLLTYSQKGWLGSVFKDINFKVVLNHKQKMPHVLPAKKTDIWFSGLSNLIKSILL